MSGRVVHFEIPADDIDRARNFYRDTFGWQMSTLPEMDYTMVSTTAADQGGTPTEPGAINGGLLARRGPIQAPVVTVDVDDIDQTLVRVEQLGGKTVLGRQAVGELGFSAYFSDSEGNLIGLWQTAR
jgi:predicted enzyme related to lactoylglutathione lyase